MHRKKRLGRGSVKGKKAKKRKEERLKKKLKARLKDPTAMMDPLPGDDAFF